MNHKKKANIWGKSEKQNFVKQEYIFGISILLIISRPFTFISWPLVGSWTPGWETIVIDADLGIFIYSVCFIGILYFVLFTIKSMTEFGF